MYIYIFYHIKKNTLLNEMILKILNLNKIYFVI